MQEFDDSAELPIDVLQKPFAVTKKGMHSHLHQLHLLTE